VVGRLKAVNPMRVIHTTVLVSDSGINVNDFYNPSTKMVKLGADSENLFGCWYIILIHESTVTMFRSSLYFP
jgi:hypothetical protein